jgi:2,4-dienoyl-CoA reductase-like NADH-dependent reductase (Old Yellow Enzyme family)
MLMAGMAHVAPISIRPCTSRYPLRPQRIEGTPHSEERVYPMSGLFSPLTLRGLTLRNRIAMAPMCIYSAGDDGQVTDLHLAHYGARALGGVGLIIVEAASVTPGGRMTLRDLGLWDDAQIAPLARLASFCQAQGAAVAIQLAHSGRKAWCDDLGHGPEPLIAPSALPQGEGWVTPRAMTRSEIAASVQEFCAAAQRALSAGLDAVEIHAAHGYLIHQFLSPISNKRNDEYGGCLENRMRFLLEITEGVRALWPADRPVLVRVSAVDWCEEGLDLADTVEIARALKARGVDLIDCSSGGILTDKPPRLGPGYQVPMAEAVKRGAGIPTMAVGSITQAEMAEEILLNERADMVALGRELLRHPNWPLDAARALGEDGPWPSIYAAGKR